MYKVSSINAIIRAISSRLVAFPCGQRPSVQRSSLIVNRFILRLRFRFLATPKISFSELEVSDYSFSLFLGGQPSQCLRSSKNLVP